MVPFDINIVNAARELWLSDANKSFATIAKELSDKFDKKISRQSVQGWQITYGWSRQEALAVALPEKAKRLLPGRLTPEEIATFKWEEEKAEFIAELAGLAHDALIVVKNSDQYKIGYRDNESAVKAALAMIEGIGKLQSGKYDVQEDGDRLPAMTAEDIKGVVMWFASKGETPRPRIHGRDTDVIDITPEAPSEEL